MVPPQSDVIQTLITAANAPNGTISLTTQTFNTTYFIFVTDNNLEYKQQETGIREQSCIPVWMIHIFTKQYFTSCSSYKL